MLPTIQQWNNFIIESSESTKMREGISDWLPIGNTSPADEPIRLKPDNVIIGWAEI